MITKLVVMSWFVHLMSARTSLSFTVRTSRKTMVRSNFYKSRPGSEGTLTRLYATNQQLDNATMDLNFPLKGMDPAKVRLRPPSASFAANH